MGAVVQAPRPDDSPHPSAATRLLPSPEGEGFYECGLSESFQNEAQVRKILDKQLLNQ